MKSQIEIENFRLSICDGCSCYRKDFNSCIENIKNFLECSCKDCIIKMLCEECCDEFIKFRNIDENIYSYDETLEEKRRYREIEKEKMKNGY